MQKINK